MNERTKVIEVVVSPTGKIRILARGYAGDSCKDATRALEQALGIVESDQPTPQMHQGQAHQRQETGQS